MTTRELAAELVDTIDAIAAVLVARGATRPEAASRARRIVAAALVAMRDPSTLADAARVD